MKKLLLVLALAIGLISPAWAVVPATRPGNAAYTITNTDTRVYTSVAFSAARTWTLPGANATCIGQNCSPSADVLIISDVAAAITATNTLTIAPPSGNTINGNAANLILSAPGVSVRLTPTSSTDWTAVVTGDYRDATVLSASAVALTTATAANITSISLSQGLWSCSANTARTLAAATSVTKLSTSISATTATVGTLGADEIDFLTAANVMAAPTSQSVPPLRILLAATTTYYLVAKDTFTVDTNAAYGTLACNRLR